MNGDIQMPLAKTPAALLAAALVATTPAVAGDQRKDDPSPSSERPDVPHPSTDKGSPMPPAFHAPGPDVGMHDPAPVRRSPVWVPPNVTDNSKTKSVSPN